LFDEGQVKITEDKFFLGLSGTSNVRDIDREIDSTVTFQCEIDQLPFNAVVCFLFLDFFFFSSISNSILDHLGISTENSSDKWY